MQLERRALHGDQIGEAALLDEVEAGWRRRWRNCARWRRASCRPCSATAASRRRSRSSPRARRAGRCSNSASTTPVPEPCRGRRVLRGRRGARERRQARQRPPRLRLARRPNGQLVVEIRDDGIGGAARDGTGMRGLADRVARSTDDHPRKPRRRRHDAASRDPVRVVIGEDQSLYREGLVGSSPTPASTSSPTRGTRTTSFARSPAIAPTSS